MGCNRLHLIRLLVGCVLLAGFHFFCLVFVLCCVVFICSNTFSQAVPLQHWRVSVQP